MRALVSLSGIIWAGVAMGQITTQQAAPLVMPDSGTRRIVSHLWDTVRVFSSPALDSLLDGAYRLGMSDKDYVVYSNERRRLIAVSKKDGRVRWLVPKETFGDVRDMKVTRDGVIRLLDRRRGVVLIISGPGEGALRDSVSLSDFGLPSQIAPLSSGRLIVLDQEARSPLVFAAKDGPQALTTPWPKFGELDGLQQQGWLSVDRSGGRWIFGFSLGNGWLAYEGERLITSGPYVEHTDFPAIVKDSSRARVSTKMARATPSALDLRIRGDSLWVLFGGKSDVKGRVLDRYSLRTGRYLSSLVLPVGPEAFVLDGPNITLLLAQPRAALVVLRSRR